MTLSLGHQEGGCLCQRTASCIRSDTEFSMFHCKLAATRPQTPFTCLSRARKSQIHRPHPALAVNPPLAQRNAGSKHFTTPASAGQRCAVVTIANWQLQVESSLRYPPTTYSSYKSLHRISICSSHSPPQSLLRVQQCSGASNHPHPSIELRSWVKWNP